VCHRDTCLAEIVLTNGAEKACFLLVAYTALHLAGIRSEFGNYEKEPINFWRAKSGDRPIRIRV
jgi:hypothetical protein